MNNKKIKYILFNIFGEKFFTNIRIMHWMYRLKKNKFYEKEINILPKFVHSGDVCIDIGANMGQYTYYLSKLAGKEGVVFSFEPINYTFDTLKKIASKLKLKNVRIKKVALGENNNEMEYIVPLGDSGILDIGQSHQYSKEENTQGEKEKVCVTTIDELMKTFPEIKKTAFIKCDVEGAELMVFRGGKFFLSQYHPVILCEIEKKHTIRYQYNPIDLINFLKEFGYDLFMFSCGKIVKIKEVQASHINYIFIHKNSIGRYIN